MKKKIKKLPVTLQTPPVKIKSTRKLISKFHNLQKQLISCEGETEKASINAEIEALGGLPIYQIASLKGSKKNNSQKFLLDNILTTREYKLLDVGAITGEIYTNKIFSVTAIDLNSQNPKVLKQDFFERPIPAQIDKFDIISLCLVLNYVPTPSRRGDMLELCASHLKLEGILYLVLPLPCITNSRYFNNQKMIELMTMLGYDLLKHHNSKKLAFYLFKRSREISTPQHFKKRLLNSDGPGKNNFTITLN